MVFSKNLSPREFWYHELCDEYPKVKTLLDIFMNTVCQISLVLFILGVYYKFWTGLLGHSVINGAEGPIRI